MRKAQVWFTDLMSNDPKDYFVHELTLKPRDGSFAVTLQPRHLYTISTTNQEIFRNFVTRPTSTHSTMKRLPSWSKYALCGATNLPGVK